LLPVVEKISSIRQQGMHPTLQQTDFVKAIGEWTDRLLQKKLLDAPFFSLMADECTDIPVVQELSIYCRWIENVMEILPLKKSR